MRAVGWVVRGRVFRGGAPVGYCVGAPSGSTLPDKYKSVMCSGEFDGMPDIWCNNPGTPCGGTPTTDHVASDVYYGWAPDPVARWCPAGSAPRYPCLGNQHCSQWSA